MKELKATPGPWRRASGIGYCAIRRDEGVIADMRFVDGLYNPSDACLIAAAPELYEAAQRLLEGYGSTDYLSSKERNSDPDVAFAIAALAKARGEV